MARTGITVVIADDDELNLKLTSILVQRHKNSRIVGLARNGAEALQKVAEQKPDLLIVDYRMPQMNGAEVIQIIRNLGDPIKIILLSAHEFEDVGEDVGADLFVQKGGSINDLIVAIDELFYTVLTKIHEGEPLWCA